MTPTILPADPLTLPARLERARELLARMAATTRHAHEAQVERPGHGNLETPGKSPKESQQD